MKNIEWNIEYKKADGTNGYYKKVTILNTFERAHETVGMLGLIYDENSKPKYRRFLYEGVVEMRIA